MQKKSVSLLLIFTLMILLPSCKKESRIDFSELVRRMERAEKEVDFERTAPFYSDGKWFLYIYDSCENEYLLCVTQEPSLLITGASLTFLNDEKGRDGYGFSELCKALLSAFTQEGTDIEKLLGETGITQNVLFSDFCAFSEQGRYKTSLFSDKIGCSFTVELIY